MLRHMRMRRLGQAALVLAACTVASTALAQSRTFSCTLPDQSRTQRVVGGQSVDHGSFPWQVSIGFTGKSALSGHFCGGILIGAEWAMTAAHCMVDKGKVWRPNDITVRHGLTQLSDGGRALTVDRIFVHPGYRGGDNDIALLKLSSPVQGARRSYATLPQPDVARRFVFTNACAVVTGWGRTAPNQRPPDRLQGVALPIVDQETCRRAYAGHYGADAVTANEICAGFPEGGRDSCNGDSGGPLVVEGGPTGFVLAGVVSWGGYDNDSNFYCALEKGYGVYTRVSRYIPWIVETVKSAR